MVGCWVEGLFQEWWLVDPVVSKPAMIWKLSEHGSELCHRITSEVDKGNDFQLNHWKRCCSHIVPRKLPMVVGEYQL